MYRKLLLLICVVLLPGLVLTEAAGAAGCPGDPNLMYCFKMDEPDGEVAGDSSGNENDGILLGMKGAMPIWETMSGVIGGAVRLRQVGYDPNFICGRLEIPIIEDSNMVGITKKAGTISVWARSEGRILGTYSFIFGMKRGSSRIQLYQFGGDSYLHLGLGNAGGPNPRQSNVKDLAANTWYHIALTWDGNDTDPNRGVYEIYVDGVSKTSATHTYEGLSAFRDEANIGNNGDGSDAGDPENSEPWQGLLDEVCIYDRVLSAVQVQDIYDNGMLGTPVGCCTCVFDEAAEPSPGRDANNVEPNKDLSWTAGQNADGHDVYFGDDFNDVNEATRSSDPTGALKSLNQAGATFDVNDAHATLLVLGKTYAWRIDEVNETPVPNEPQWPGKTWTFRINDGKCYDPEPEHEDDSFPRDANFMWVPGDFVEASAGHHVYLGTSFADVNQGIGGTDKGTVDANQYFPSLNIGTDYFWRVDEVNSVLGTSKGDVWSFTTEPDLLIDNFEAYNGTGSDPESDPNKVMYRWNELAKGYVYLETLEAPHGGDNAMRMAYLNESLPYYSEAEFEYTDPCDWTCGGYAKGMSFWYAIDANADYLYAKITDDNGKAAEVVHPDPNLDRGTWNDWNIELADFEQSAPNDVDLTIVRKFVIGIDGTITKARGDGYFDDIDVYAPKDVSSKRQPDGDINGDGIVDEEDLDSLHDAWLEYDYNTVGWDGIMHNFPDDNSQWVTGKSGIGSTGALRFQGITEDEYSEGSPWVSDWVDVDDYALPNFNNKTITAWVRSEGNQIASWNTNIFGTHGAYDVGLMIEEYPDTPYLRARVEDAKLKYWGTVPTKQMQPGVWHHCALVIRDMDKKRCKARLYMDGFYRVEETTEEAQRGAGPIVRHTDTERLRGAAIGSRNDGANNFLNGIVDDFRIYNDAVDDDDTAKNALDPNINAIQLRKGRTDPNFAAFEDPNNMLIYFKFDDGTGKDMVQDSGKDASTKLYHEIHVSADYYDEEPKYSKMVGFADYAQTAKDWLVKEYWPSPLTVKNCLYDVTAITYYGTWLTGVNMCPKDLDDECHTLGSCTSLGDCTDTITHMYGDGAAGCCVTFTEKECSAVRSRKCPTDTGACP